jgi:N-acetylmuramoyl-L-alanine amidase
MAYGHLLLLGPAKRRYFDAPSQMPGALIEPLFITDPFEASIAVSSRGQRLIADGIARAVTQYFSSPEP